MSMMDKPPPVIERPPILKGPPAIEGPSGVKILEKRPIGVGQFLREKIAIRDIIIEGPGPFIAGGGLRFLIEESVLYKMAYLVFENS
jgi:hypothetical protein